MRLTLNEDGKPAKVDILEILNDSPGNGGKRFITLDLGYEVSIILEGFEQDAANRALEIAEALTAAARALMKPRIPEPAPTHPTLTDDDIPF